MIVAYLSSAVMLVNIPVAATLGVVRPG